MKFRISQIRLPLDESEIPLKTIAARALHVGEQEILHLQLIRKSVDARDKRNVHFSLTLDVELSKPLKHLPRNVEMLPPEVPEPSVPRIGPVKHRPLVVGMGPAGLFAALRLAQAGLEPLIIERGRNVDRRTADVENFWCSGELNPVSNVQFGEGGAGTFSDGKLNSGIKSPYCREILETFQRMGAPEEILYSARPHIGTDKLRMVVRNLRKEILRLGGEVRFENKLDAVHIERGQLAAASINGEWRDVRSLILAIGHSARDTFAMLSSAGIFMERKPFSIGVRIEHSQCMVNRAQYGAAAGHPALDAADYKLSCHLPDGRAAYTFCMCPGGQVVAAASEPGGIAVNGMSTFARDGTNANSALLVSVTPEDFGGDDPLAGVRFQQRWEHAAFLAGGENYHAPAQTVCDFLANRPSTGPGDVLPSYRPGVTWTNFEACLPEYVLGDMRKAIFRFDRQLHGFAHAGAVLTGVETRSSSPLRITRDGQLQSVSARGIYPCGEGAGYAGGILSAATDGLRCAEALMRESGSKHP